MTEKLLYLSLNETEAVFLWLRLGMYRKILEMEEAANPTEGGQNPINTLNSLSHRVFELIKPGKNLSDLDKMRTAFNKGSN